MAFQEINATATDIKKFVDKPFIGHYKGSQKITTKIGDQTIWKFMDEEGNPFGIYGFTNLNRVMENAILERLMRITYRGTQKVQTKFGMKDVHQVTVEADDGNE